MRKYGKCYFGDIAIAGDRQSPQKRIFLVYKNKIIQKKVKSKV